MSEEMLKRNERRLLEVLGCLHSTLLDAWIDDDSPEDSYVYKMYADCLDILDSIEDMIYLDCYEEER